MKCSDNTLIYSKGFLSVLGSAIFLQHIYPGIHFSDWPGGKKGKKKKKKDGKTQLWGKISIYTQ